MFTGSAVHVLFIDSPDLSGSDRAHRIGPDPLDEKIGKMLGALALVQVRGPDNAIDDSPARIDVHDVEQIAAKLFKERFVFGAGLNLSRGLTSGEVHSNTAMRRVVVDDETFSGSRIQPDLRI